MASTHLDPERKRIEAAPLNERDEEHRRELAVCPPPDGHRHQRGRGPPPLARLSALGMQALEEMLPKDEKREKEHADDEERDDVYTQYERINVNCVVRNMQ